MSKAAEKKTRSPLWVSQVPVCVQMVSTLWTCQPPYHSICNQNVPTCLPTCLSKVPACQPAHHCTCHLKVPTCQPADLSNIVYAITKCRPVCHTCLPKVQTCPHLQSLGLPHVFQSFQMLRPALHYLRINMITITTKLLSDFITEIFGKFTELSERFLAAYLFQPDLLFPIP